MNILHAEAFFRSATLRQAIYYKKEVLKLPYPWTTDARFNSVFFCNVFRWQDKTTKMILSYVPTLTSDEDYRRLVAYRYSSRMSTIEALSSKWDGRAETLDALCARLKPLYTSGFIICPLPNVPKYKNIGIVVGQIDVNAIRARDSLESTWEYLTTLRGIGPFMAYEIVTDLSYYSEYVDVCSWSSPGPGARRGMSRVLYGGLQPHHEDYQAFSLALYEMWSNYDVERDMAQYLPKEHVAEACRPFRERLTMREVEHWLCEYDKYKRSTRNKRSYP